MQYILTEEEFEIYRRCMATIKSDYNHIKINQTGNPHVENRRKLLEYSLGITNTIPKKFE